MKNKISDNFALWNVMNALSKLTNWFGAFTFGGMVCSLNSPKVFWTLFVFNLVCLVASFYADRKKDKLDKELEVNTQDIVAKLNKIVADLDEKK